MKCVTSARVQGEVNEVNGGNMKYNVEFRTMFDMETDGGESYELLEDLAWDKFNQLGREGELEWDVDINLEQ